MFLFAHDVDILIYLGNDNKVVLQDVTSGGGGELVVVERFVHDVGSVIYVKCIAPKLRAVGIYSYRLRLTSPACYVCSYSYKSDDMKRDHGLSREQTVCRFC